MNTMPEIGLLRLPQIIGDRKAEPPIAPLIPVSRATWYAGIKQGRYPAPVKLGERAVAWRAEEIRALIQGLSA
jgi:prophage regulatory protein